jgi:hypothetical protein
LRDSRIVCEDVVEIDPRFATPKLLSLQRGCGFRHFSEPNDMTLAS